MKDKRTEQRLQKERHIAERQAAKARRRGDNDLVRAAPTRVEKPVILIVCEGKNTEPDYFLHFELTSAIVKPIGKGWDPLSLVDEALRLKQEAEAVGKPYEQVWCAFDRDNVSANKFNGAIIKAQANDIKVAYSNDAFEYWLLLHFENHQGGSMSRTDYTTKLNGYLAPWNIRYDGKGSKKMESAFFALLEQPDTQTGRIRRDIAIERARTIQDAKQAQGLTPFASCSTTTVYQLVEEILKFI